MLLESFLFRFLRFWYLFGLWTMQLVDAIAADVFRSVFFANFAILLVKVRFW